MLYTCYLQQLLLCCAWLQLRLNCTAYVTGSELYCISQRCCARLTSYISEKSCLKALSCGSICVVKVIQVFLATISESQVTLCPK